MGMDMGMDMGMGMVSGAGGVAVAVPDGTTVWYGKDVRVVKRDFYSWTG